MMRPTTITIIEEASDGMPIASVVEYELPVGVESEPPLRRADYRRVFLVDAGGSLAVYPIVFCLN